MSSASPSIDEIRDYLLRRMSESSRIRFEEAYFADDALLDRIENEEDALVSDFVLGKLNDSDRRRFEGSLLMTPYYQGRVETTRGLKLKLASVPARDRAPRRGAEETRLFPGRTGVVVGFSLMAALLVASLVSAWSLKRDLEALRSKSASAPPADAGAGPAVLLLEAGDAGGPAVARVRAAVPLLVVAPRRAMPAGLHSSTRLEAALVDAHGRTVWKSGLFDVPAAADVVLRVPAASLSKGRYSFAICPAGRPADALLVVVDAAD